MRWRAMVKAVLVVCIMALSIGVMSTGGAEAAEKELGLLQILRGDEKSGDFGDLGYSPSL